MPSSRYVLALVWLASLPLLRAQENTGDLEIVVRTQVEAPTKSARAQPSRDPLAAARELADAVLPPSPNPKETN